MGWKKRLDDCLVVAIDRYSTRVRVDIVEGVAASIF